MYMSIRQRLFKLLLVIAILAMTFSNIQPATAQRSGGDGLKRQVNAESGKVSFMSPESGRALSAAQALGTSIRPQNPAMALVKRFAPEFGVKNPERELVEMKSNHGSDGRMSVRYQQQYQGIPVLGGELIVNTNDNGDLYSINGEVSPELSLSTQPMIETKQVKETVLQLMAKWYQRNTKEFIITEPELWVFDESLLQPGTRPVELVWRMEVTSKDDAMPVRELVLVNAQNGHISLHFNQIDTELEETSKEESIQNQPAYVGGATWYVATTGNNANSCSTPASACATIEEAIYYRASTGDTIDVAIGTYTNNVNHVISFDKNVLLSGGWNSTFTTQNGMSTLDGQNVRRVVDVGSLVSATMDHFVIQNGRSDQGAGIFNNWTLTLNNSIVQNNTATNGGVGSIGGDGGGIYNSSGTLTLNNTVVINNKATFSGTVGAGGDGGGITSVGGTLTLHDSRVENNIATYSGYTPDNGGQGGGISTSGLTILNNSTIKGNSALHGGGILTGSANDLTIAASIIMENRSYYEGGGLFLYGGNTNLTNVTISNNSAMTSGGGIYIDAASAATLNINNSTLTQNFVSSSTEAATGGGIANDYNRPVTIKNTIIAGNAAIAMQDCSGQITSAGNNLIGYNYGCSLTPAAGDQIGTVGAPLDAKLGNLASNGGTTLTHALLIGSPALNAGNNATCATTDQRGVARPQGARCDIGAFEGSIAQSVHAVIKTYTAGNAMVLPGTFLCDDTDPACGPGDAQAKAAHIYALGTYDLYRTKHTRNGIDQNN